MAGSFTSEREIEDVVLGFESCTTGKDNFSHRDHVAVAVWYLRRDPQQAANQMRASLHRFLDHYDCRAHYHETLTLFWIHLVGQTLAALDANLNLLQATNAVVERLGNSRIAFEFYSKALVGSDTAKQGWVEPDLKRL